MEISVHLGACPRLTHGVAGRGSDACGARSFGRCLDTDLDTNGPLADAYGLGYLIELLVFSSV